MIATTPTELAANPTPNPTLSLTPNRDQLEQRLDDPRVAANLSRLLDHLDSVAFVVEAFEGFVARGETITDSVSEAVNELRQASVGIDAGSDLLKRAPKLIETGARLADAATQIHTDELEKSQVLDRLTQPATLALLNDLIDRLPLLAMMAGSLESFIGRSEQILDNVSGLIGELKAQGVDFDPAQLQTFLETIPKLKKATDQLLGSEQLLNGFPKVIDAGVSMIESGMLDKDVVATLGYLGRASASTFQEVSGKPVDQVGGLFSILKATRDPDVKKTLSFGLALAKAFAKHLK